MVNIPELNSICSHVHSQTMFNSSIYCLFVLNTTVILSMYVSHILCHSYIIVIYNRRLLSIQLSLKPHFVMGYVIVFLCRFMIVFHERI